MTKVKPFISVVVPVYNAETTINRCVNSVLSQSYTNWELLLVDDGSSDASGSICDEYAKHDSRIKVFHKENGGVSSARNVGIVNAIGEWITFVDADDFIEGNFLSLDFGWTEDLLIQNYRFVGDEYKEKLFTSKSLSKDDFPRFINSFLHEEWLRTPWGKFFKLSIIKDNNLAFLENVRIGEDAIFVQDYLTFCASARQTGMSGYVYSCDNNYSRYVLTAIEALRIFHLFIERYIKLNANCPKHLYFAFRFYWGLICPKLCFKESAIWYKDNIVCAVYDEIASMCSFKWKLKYQYLKYKTILWSNR